ncbi:MULTISPECIES: helix-turn-helix transcriptional regulator [unclassified Chelatococcus]|uniref:helix-turn-helix transcriptional regulator n=1 Tax=unclassified Chelatococcus TaxID=2638111 RepID=UPI001BCEFDBF|nr:MULTISPECIES: helix-turn-helix transcriptional regulator [unclassified Chelatococcus]MBS7699418.1 AraC family transcriptional regulator [Chelatococcus sp. YT9]MBX3557690.1 AraC family transcriptional regulator [Chelatococcus sp.]
MLSETIDLVPTTGSSEIFEADFSSWAFGDLVLTRTLYGNAPARHWRHRPKSFLDHWCVVLAYEGADSASSPQVRQPGSLSFRSLSQPFEGRAKDAEVLTLYLPRSFHRDERENLDRQHDLKINPELGALLAGHIENLARHLPHIPTDQANGLAEATRSLVAACIAPRRDHAKAAEVPLSALLIDRVRLIVRQNMASPDFDPEQLARLVAMSRSKLYRLFEHVGGVAHFINRERLREAHRHLTSSAGSLPIHVVGAEVGFTDHSTFSRAFRREFGYSPSEVRERSLAEHALTPFGCPPDDESPAYTSRWAPPLESTNVSDETSPPDVAPQGAIIRSLSRPAA